MTIGLCADFMAEIMPFLRHFEKDIDVALLPRLVAEFRTRLQKLFLDCRILEDIEDSDDIDETMQSCALPW